MREATQIAELLLSLPEIDVNVKNKEGWTPLHLAVIRGQTDAIKWALKNQNKFDFTMKGGENYSTILQLASNLNMFEIV